MIRFLHTHGRNTFFLVIFATVVTVVATHPAVGAPQAGIAIGGGPVAHPEGIHHHSYANPDAPKGGTLRLSTVGTFNKLNPFSLKGQAPPLMLHIVFESLAAYALDELAVAYGLVAESIEPDDDGLGVTYRLNPKARFSDGHPVSAADVVFSFDVLQSPEAQPFYKSYYEDIESVTTPDQHTIYFKFRKQNRELAATVGELPVLPKHLLEGQDFGRTFLETAIGTGPYVVESYEFGKVIRFKKNPNYWGAALGMNVGKNNFDNVIYLYYRDATARMEGLKAGDFDFATIPDAKTWAKTASGWQWDTGALVKKKFSHDSPAGVKGFAFNMRREKFQNPRVRQALSLALDFPWYNDSMLYGEYRRAKSYFANSELAAPARPDAAELELLEPLRDKLAPAVFTDEVGQLEDAFPNMRAAMVRALKLFKEEGYTYKPCVCDEGSILGRESCRCLADPQGNLFEIEMLLQDPDQIRFAEPYFRELKQRLGISCYVKVVDSALYETYVRNYNFDMILAEFWQSVSPGNEQRSYWHSAVANDQGTNNVLGIQDPAVDALVETVISAPTRSALVTATRALDRVLWHGYYMVPLWYDPYLRSTYNGKLAHPDVLPRYPTSVGFLMHWWWDRSKPAAGEGSDQSNPR